MVQLIRYNIADYLALADLDLAITRCDGCGSPEREHADLFEKAGRFDPLPLRWMCPFCRTKWGDDG